MFSTRQLAVACGAALAVAAGAGPAFASGASSSSGVRAKTPLVTALTADSRFIQTNYTNPTSEVDTSLYAMAGYTSSLAHAIAGTPSDSGQLPAKLEWVLGALLETRGDYGLEYGEQNLIYHHDAVGNRAVRTGLANYRLANTFISDADVELGVPHRALEAEPYALAKRTVTPTERAPYVANISTASLTATIESASSVIEESIPFYVRTTNVTINQAAAEYFGLVAARQSGDAAQRPAQAEWVRGIHTLLAGDEQLARVVAYCGPPESTATSCAVGPAFATLRGADAQLARADALLGIHDSQPAVRLPATTSDLLN